jgi:CRP/FNR family cyclic AMP-dependent transcriptional regulator
MKSPPLSSVCATLGLTDLQFVTTDSLKRAATLDATEWSNEFDWPVIRTLARYMNVYQSQETGVLFHEYARESYMCIVLTGSVRVLKKDSNGRPKELNRFSSGKVIGEMSLLDGQPRSATLVAVETSTFLIFTLQELDRLAVDEPKVAYGLLRKIGRDISLRLRKTSGQLVEHLG